MTDALDLCIVRKSQAGGELSHSADIIFTSDESNPHAEAVAVKANRIVYVGNNVGAEERRGELTRVIDAQCHTLTPGFIDSHFHLWWGATRMESALLYSVTNLEELKETLQSFAAQNRTSEWVDGRGLKYGIVSTRQELDAINSDRPIYINVYDGHTSWANTKALEMAGVLHPGKALATLFRVAQYQKCWRHPRPWKRLDSRSLRPND